MRTTARRTHEVVNPRRRMPRAEREAQILAVAEEVFADLGYQATTMDEIAERVGVTKPLIYDYFGSKDGLLIACVDRARTLLAETTEEALRALPPEASVDDVLRCGIAAFFDFIDDHDLASRAAAPGERGGPCRPPATSSGSGPSSARSSSTSCAAPPAGRRRRHPARGLRRGRRRGL